MTIPCAQPGFPSERNQVIPHDLGLSKIQPPPKKFSGARQIGYTSILEHFLLAMGYCGFIVVHIAQVLRAGWNNLRSMITGYELREEP
jgi:thiosulfate reductase cytochrome b subunit